MRVSIPMLGALLLMAFGAADAKQRSVRYVPPEGFAGHPWGEPRVSFARLPEKPIGIGASWMPALVTQTFDGCSSTSVSDCLLTIWEHREGGGFYVMSEYSIDGQGFRFGEQDPVVMYPVVYQFCANWQGAAGKRKAPPNFDEINRFCGVRLMFQSETRAELAKLPADYVTTYDRVLDKLLEKFGKPAGFVRRGVVTIESLEGETEGAPERRFRIFRWCPAFDRRLHTPCTASVVLTLDPVTGVGMVLYSTPLVWEFAYAREHDFKNDRLFHILHARK